MKRENSSSLFVSSEPWPLLPWRKGIGSIVIRLSDCLLLTDNPGQKYLLRRARSPSWIKPVPAGSTGADELDTHLNRGMGAPLASEVLLPWLNGSGSIGNRLMGTSFWLLLIGGWYLLCRARRLSWTNLVFLGSTGAEHEIDTGVLMLSGMKELLSCASGAIWSKLLGTIRLCLAPRWWVVPLIFVRMIFFVSCGRLRKKLVWDQVEVSLYLPDVILHYIFIVATLELEYAYQFMITESAAMALT